MLCDPGEALVVELSAHRGTVRHPREGLLTATNHYQSASMHALKGRFPPRPPFSVLSSYHFTEAYSQARDHRLQELEIRRDQVFEHISRANGRQLVRIAD